MKNIFIFPERKKFGQILLENNLISPEQLEKALALQKNSVQRIGEILVSIGAITLGQVAEVLAVQLGILFISLDEYQVQSSAVKLLPRKIAESFKAIPLKFEDHDTLLVTMADPVNIIFQDEIKKITGHKIKIAASGLDDIERNLSRIYDIAINLEQALGDTPKSSANTYTTLSLTTSKLESTDAPIIELVNNTISQAVTEGASDIHIEAYETMCRIRFRVDGFMYTHFEYPVDLHQALVSRIKIMASMDISERRIPQDGRILTIINQTNVDLRVSSLPTITGEKIVIRILDREQAFSQLNELGLDGGDLEIIKNFCALPWGIVLATGPTGSGKSTTLYSMLSQISKPDINIVTVEDPVEFYIPGINQVNVNEKIGLTFGSILRSILRQDPDKIMIGEIRDTDTAQIAIRAALTGHLVLSTLHTNDAPGAVARMIDIGTQPFLLAASLVGVIAQRLVRCLCPHCKEEYEIDSKTCEKINIPVGSHAYKPVGCPKCRNGYKGRRGIFEIMVVNEELRDLILKSPSSIELRSAAIKNGMKTLARSGINAALSGSTSLEEVLIMQS